MVRYLQEKLPLAQEVEPDFIITNIKGVTRVDRLAEIAQNRNATAQNRDAIAQNRDAIAQNRDATAQNRDAIAQSRENINRLNEETRLGNIKVLRDAQNLAANN
ncbi:MAG: hypothetical protein LBD88_03245 [Candidatus Peribacteria bacterium]|jgi:uncharacterized protein (DUF3084 family)|nr:hypothetical protein [Candidatus Peribacteria bacterium]